MCGYNFYVGSKKWLFLKIKFLEIWKHSFAISLVFSFHCWSFSWHTQLPPAPSSSFPLILASDLIALCFFPSCLCGLIISVLWAFWISSVSLSENCQQSVLLALYEILGYLGGGWGCRRGLSLPSASVHIPAHPCAPVTNALLSVRV